MKVRWSPSAKQSYLETLAELSEWSLASADHLIADVERVEAIAAVLPRSFGQVPGQKPPVRRALLARHQLWLIYEIRRDHIEVVALWPTHRHPAGWKSRG